jgi:hypothetical protein
MGSYEKAMQAVRTEEEPQSEDKGAEDPAASLTAQEQSRSEYIENVLLSPLI